MSDDAEARSLGAVFGEGLLIATVATALVAVPAALRAGSGGVSLPLAWIALWGSAALVIAPVAASFRIARPLPRLALCVPVGFAMALPVLLVFARVLKTATHHRPLGGATFAILAAGLVFGAAVFALRLIAWSERRSGPVRQAPWALAGLGALASLPLVLPMLSGPLRPSLLDGALGLGALAAGALVTLPAALGRRASVIGVVLFVVAVGAGLGLGLGAAETRLVLSDAAPVLLGLAGWLRP